MDESISQPPQNVEFDSAETGGGGPPWWNIGWRALMPASILVGSLLVSLAIYFGFLGSSLVDQVAAWTATWTSIGLNSIGFSTTVSGTILASDTFAVNIVAECTAVGPLVLFMGAVAAYPSPWKSKGMGLLMGLVVLTGVNVIRIMSLFWIGATYPQYLDVAHLLVWQSVIILLAIVLWLFWVDRMAGVRNV
ncbi:MAG: archaeosortase/exosortase family protein [SAR202 cluster bacterium]|jgi:exosortase/archaeosortase family protein|nr:archaeosortase/exosortase family protein [SAR202 cluster bacterium]MDP6713782.1 archaeosortase/exosortase family protein [SAR202 cluster bacterium]